MKLELRRWSTTQNLVESRSVYRKLCTVYRKFYADFSQIIENYRQIIENYRVVSEKLSFERVESRVEK